MCRQSACNVSRCDCESDTSTIRTFPNSVRTFSMSSIEPTVRVGAYCWIVYQYDGPSEPNNDQRAVLHVKTKSSERVCVCESQWHVSMYVCVWSHTWAKNVCVCLCVCSIYEVIEKYYILHACTRCGAYMCVSCHSCHVASTHTSLTHTVKLADTYACVRCPSRYCVCAS